MMTPAKRKKLGHDRLASPVATDNCIETFFHCRQCMAELPEGVSPREWAQLEVGFTVLGFQVWCKRHEINVVHMDFQTQKHPAI